ncbi:MAG: hypothetical protein HDS20_01190 [Bacteroides sp.]|nr:hypothetical protein [Bacteroides sp.]
MEVVLRYIFVAVIVYAVGMGIYKAVRSRAVDYPILAIIVLLGAVLWISRGFLISSQIYDFLIIAIWVVAMGCFVLSSKSQYGKHLKSVAIVGLSIFLAVFSYWNIMAQSIVPTTLITSLKGYSTSRTDEICLFYNGTPFWRSYNLNNYPNVKLLPEQYDVRVTIKPISTNIVKLESITLIPKAKI